MASAPVSPFLALAGPPEAEVARSHLRKLLRRIVVATFALVLLMWGSLAIGIWLTYHAAEYPAATTIDTSDTLRAAPGLVFRRVETYRSTDSFSVIYKWYAQRFGLGPERFANSNCLLMARTSTVFGPINLNASVMVCENTSFRMMFVQRTYLLRLPMLFRR